MQTITCKEETKEVTKTYIEDGYLVEERVVRVRRLTEEEIDEIRERKLQEIEERHWKNAPKTMERLEKERETELDHFSVISCNGVIKCLNVPIIRRNKHAFEFCRKLASDTQRDVLLLSINPFGKCYYTRTFRPK